jgi:lipopolysaccharide transport system ATP-binding protein
MSNTAIKIENLSKIYRLGEIGTGTISRDMERWFKTKVLKQEDPFLKIGETNDRANKGNSDIVYSLQDINFEIQQGDAVGIIGRNGAGKSTLLKILSRVTTPTTGRINIKGRVASLLEVGTGFHPELTGRENIYLNGAILGMRKREIDRKLDEIIDFSGVERYIDTPVKRYSSGMYVRLAFAVAAHLESEILIVDEVLAVGDAEFQKKCLGKMGEVSKGEGRTVLFVSHNMGSVKKLCTKGVFLQNGLIKNFGDIDAVLNSYSGNLTSNNYSDLLKLKKRYGSGEVKFSSFKFINSVSKNFLFTQPIEIEIKLLVATRISKAILNIFIDDNMGNRIALVAEKERGKYISRDYHPGLVKIRTTINHVLQPNSYNFSLFIGRQLDGKAFDYIEHIESIEVSKNGYMNNESYIWDYIHGQFEIATQFEVIE